MLNGKPDRTVYPYTDEQPFNETFYKIQFYALVSLGFTEIRAKEILDAHQKIFIEIWNDSCDKSKYYIYSSLCNMQNIEKAIRPLCVACSINSKWWGFLYSLLSINVEVVTVITNKSEDVTPSKIKELQEAVLEAGIDFAIRTKT